MEMMSIWAAVVAVAVGVFLRGTRTKGVGRRSGCVVDSGLDAIVVGAGVAGSALACTLGKYGRRVLVVERDLSEPDRIIVELFQLGGYLKLLELGLKDCLECIDAQRVLGYALFKGGLRFLLS